MKLLRLAPIALCTVTLFTASLHAAETNVNYLTASRLDPIALLAPPPLPGSPEQAADLAETAAVHNARTADEEKLAHSQKKFDVFAFRPIIGDFFQAEKLPKTDAFFRQVQAATGDVTDTAKNFWKRPRPYTVDPTLADGDVEKSFSYPSGHSTRGTVFALILADLFPDKRDAILAEGRAIGWRRVIIAKHYPTDIYAGRVLAQAIVRNLKENPAFQKDLSEARAEIAAAQK